MKIINEKAIVVGLENLDLSQFPSLKVVGCNMTSCEHLPLKEIEEKGIKLISLKDYPLFLQTITSTAEHTIGLIIALLRKYNLTFTDNLDFQKRDNYIGYKLAGKTLGIIGHGRIGQQVEKKAESFGMNILVYEEYMPINVFTDMLNKSDIITIHIPLFGNRGFFTRAMFSLMKPTAYFVNTSRGEIVEKDALIYALKNNIIKGAAVDFIDNDLVEYAKTHNNLILTPHLGGNTYEDRKLTEEFITKKVNEYLKNNAISN